MKISYEYQTRANFLRFPFTDSPENSRPGERTRGHDIKLVQPRSDRIRRREPRNVLGLVTQNYLQGVLKENRQMHSLSNTDGKRTYATVISHESLRISRNHAFFPRKKSEHPSLAGFLTNSNFIPISLSLRENDFSPLESTNQFRLFALQICTRESTNQYMLMRMKSTTKRIGKRF